MIDPKLLRSDPAKVAQNLARRGFVLDVPALQALEEQRRHWQLESDRLRAEHNVQARGVGQAKARGEDIAPLLARGEALTGQIAVVDGQLGQVQRELEALQLELPNLLQDSVPEGGDERANVEVRRWGEPTAPAFKVRDHVELGERLGGLDFAAAGRMAGARFVIVRGALARLQRALAQFMLDLHTGEHGYMEVYTPLLVNPAALLGTGQLPRFEQDLFAVKGEQNFYLIPTAEVPLTNLVREQIVPAEALPIKLVAHTPCFRSEAGAYGRDTRGMIRQHQFEKVELVQIVRPSESAAAHEQLTRTPRRCSGASGSRTDCCHSAPEMSARPVPRPTILRCGCRRRILTARFPPAATARPIRRGAWRRAGAIRRPASRNPCIRSTVQAWRSAGHWWR